MFWQLCIVAVVACSPQMAGVRTHSQALHSESIQAATLAQPTLSIVNTGVEPFHVYDQNGLRIRVYPGERKCVKITGFGPRVLVVSGMRESAVTPMLYPHVGEGWELRLGINIRVDVFSLKPVSSCVL
jgi:hypothetical protein